MMVLNFTYYINDWETRWSNLASHMTAYTNHVELLDRQPDATGLYATGDDEVPNRYTIKITPGGESYLLFQDEYRRLKDELEAYMNSWPLNINDTVEIKEEAGG